MTGTNVCAKVVVNNLDFENGELKRPSFISNSEEPGELIVVSCYSRFDNLAHGPKGTESKRSLYVYKLKDGELLLMNMTGENVENPAFSRYNPRLNMLYVCTEDVTKNGKVISYKVEKSGVLRKLSELDAGGSSTCYLTMDKTQQNMLVANYWDSTLVTLPMDYDTGCLSEASQVYDPKEGAAVKACTKTHANHSNNDASTIAERQGDPHSHAIVLDPFEGVIAYVPDLGMDVIREFYYNQYTGHLEPLSVIPTGDPEQERVPHGPRYMVFHTTSPIVYVINEISSTIGVYALDVDLIKKINKLSEKCSTIEEVRKIMKERDSSQTLKLIQLIRIIPEAFPSKYTTAGRICMHSSGDFIIVSNRGHESVAVCSLSRNIDSLGRIEKVDFYHTRGYTPRHFAFDSTGNWMMAANQDSDKLTLFHFDTETGKITFTGNDYDIPSPNFICSCPIEDVISSHKSYSPSLRDPIGLSLEMDSMKSTLSKAMAEIRSLREEITILKAEKEKEKNEQS